MILNNGDSFDRAKRIFPEIPAPFNFQVARQEVFMRSFEMNESEIVCNRNTINGLKKKSFYVYVWLDPRKSSESFFDGYKFRHEPFYIGKGQGRRCLDLRLRSAWVKSKLSKIKNSKNKLILTIFNCSSEREAFDKEIFLINQIGRSDLKAGPLLNLTNGGEGVAGKPLSKEHKEKLSKSGKGRKAWNLGKKLTKEQRAKIGLKGKSNPFFGKKHSEESLIKMSKAHKAYLADKKNHPMFGKKHSEGTKLKIREKALGRVVSDETKNKMRIASKNRPPQTKESRSRRSMSLMGHTVSEETRKKISNTIRMRNKSNE